MFGKLRHGVIVGLKKRFCSSVIMDFVGDLSLMSCLTVQYYLQKQVGDELCSSSLVAIVKDLLLFLSVASCGFERTAETK